jgi:long-subunit fatty acid transport protein
VPLDLGLGYQVYDSVSGAFRQVSIVNGDVRQIGYLLDGGTRTSFSLGTSYEFLTNLFLGGSISYTTGILTSDREYEEHDTQDAYGTDRPTNPSDPQTADWQYMYLHDVREVSTKGVDVRFGVLYKLFNWISIGGAVKVPSVASVSENRVTEGYAQYAAGRKVTERPETYLDYNLRPPMEISAGTAMNLWFIRATAEATYIDYTEMEFTSGFDLADRSLKNKEIKEVFRPVVHLNVGAEFDVPLTGLQLRAGGMYRMSPYSDEVNNVTDEQPRQFDQFYLSAGLGINLSDRVAFDLAYMVGFWEESRRAYPSSLSTITQDVVVHNALVTTRFRL